MIKKVLVCGALLLGLLAYTQAQAEDEIVEVINPDDSYLSADDPEVLMAHDEPASIFSAPVSSSLASSAGFLPGFFVQLQGGIANDGWDKLHDFEQRRGLQYFGGFGTSGRLAVGYDFNRTMAFDFGLMYFGKFAEVTTMADTTTVLENSRTFLLDLNAKLSMPLPYFNKISVFNKLGLGISRFSGEDDYFPICNNHAAFMYGFGLNYYLTPKLAFDLSWSHYDGVAVLQKYRPAGIHLLHYQPSADFYALGVTYKFGDVQSLEGIEEDNLSGLEADPYLSGFYLGLQSGYADSGWGNLSGYADPNFFLETHQDNGFGLRVYAGYDLSEHWGLEAGYLYVINTAYIDYKNPLLIFQQIAAIKTQAVDLLLKMRWPIVEGLAFYSKAGVGYLQATGLQSSDGTLPTQQDPIFAKDKFTHVAPVYGFGFSYDITSHATIDISGMRYLGSPSLERSPGDLIHGPQFLRYQPNVNIMMLGLQYKI